MPGLLDVASFRVKHDLRSLPQLDATSGHPVVWPKRSGAASQEGDRRVTIG